MVLKKIKTMFIKFIVLDDIGHGIRSTGTPRQQKQRGSSQGSIQSVVGMNSMSSGNSVGPPPTTKPPTPPQVSRTSSKGKTIV